MSEIADVKVSLPYFGGYSTIPSTAKLATKDKQCMRIFQDLELEPGRNPNRRSIISRRLCLSAVTTGIRHGHTTDLMMCSRLNATLRKTTHGVV